MSRLLTPEEIQKLKPEDLLLIISGEQYKFIAKDIVENTSRILTEAHQKEITELQDDMVFIVLEYFKNYTRSWQSKYPAPTDEMESWFGSIWDMIKCAGKEDFKSKYGEKK